MDTPLTALTVIKVMFLGGGLIPLIGAASLIGLAVFAVATAVIQLRRPVGERDPDVFLTVERWQWVFFLVTHTVYNLAVNGCLNLVDRPYVGELMRFVSVAFVGLAVESPACLIMGWTVCMICGKRPIVRHKSTVIAALAMVCIVELIAVHTVRLSVEHGWLHLKPTPGVQKPIGITPWRMDFTTEMGDYA